MNIIKKIDKVLLSEGVVKFRMDVRTSNPKVTHLAETLLDILDHINSGALDDFSPNWSNLAKAMSKLKGELGYDDTSY